MEEERITGECPEKEEELLPEAPNEVTEEVSEPLGEKTDGEEENAEQTGGDPYAEYAAIEQQDLDELKREFPELGAVKRIIDLSNPLRYAQLRDLGLSAREAYLASSGTHQRGSGKGHLRGTVPKGAHVKDGSMSPSELRAARDLFGQLSDDELQRLYRRVTK